MDDEPAIEQDRDPFTGEPMAGRYTVTLTAATPRPTHMLLIRTHADGTETRIKIPLAGSGSLDDFDTTPAG